MDELSPMMQLVVEKYRQEPNLPPPDPDDMIMAYLRRSIPREAAAQMCVGMHLAYALMEADPEFTRAMWEIIKEENAPHALPPAKAVTTILEAWKNMLKTRFVLAGLGLGAPRQ